MVDFWTNFFLVSWLISIPIYFIPGALAFYKGKKNAWPILVLNIFMGWTLIGWVVALCWALAYEEKK